MVSPGHVLTDFDSWTMVSPGHVLRVIDSLRMDSDSCWPNPCPDGTKCALSKSNGDFCLSYDCPSVTLHSCGFENENDTSCIFKNSLQDDFDWTRHFGGTPSSNTGPTKAASGSYYMYTEVSNVQNGDRAVLTTQTASLTASSFCLSFQYHMKGAPGTLKVFAGDKNSSLTSIWEKSGVQPYPEQWKYVNIQIPQFNNPVVYECGVYRLLFSFNGEELPPEVRSIENCIAIIMTTDGSVNKGGFSANFYKITS
ncbi:MAM domain-containing glycosylphosphatidylinositol anchor protein 1-like [Mytilus trossulus]|uniref:MAM domain-containing glycosylphosphatidylinositol anchor protein 1-like n=1 Tax=Mytilus trossulus TaxID=6551 RepID=UPI003003EAB9